MFCGKCGAPLEEDSMFCNECGAQVERPSFPTGTNPAPGQTAEAPRVTLSERWNRLDKKGKVICVVIALAVLCGVFAHWYNGKIVRLDPYVDVEFTGYDGIGYAHATFDQDAFLREYGNKIKLKGKSADLLGELEGLTGNAKNSAVELLVSECASCSLDKNDHLKNGDEVTLTWDCEDMAFEAACGKKLKYSEKVFKVEGLEEIELVNPFEKLEIQYEGVAPYGQAYVASTGNEAYLRDVWFELEPRDGLSNGDTVKVSVEGYNEERMAEQYGIGFSATENTYTVSGLSEYITTAGDISEDVMEQMIDQGKDVMTSDAAKTWSGDVSLDKVKYIGNYFLNAKGNNAECKNKLILVYSVNATITVEDVDKREKVSYYTYIAYRDIMKSDTEEAWVDLQRYETCPDYFNVEVDTGGWWNNRYTFAGYEKLDMLNNQTVVVNADRFTSEENIDE